MAERSRWISGDIGSTDRGDCADAIAVNLDGSPRAILHGTT